MTDYERLLEEDYLEIAGRRFRSRLIIGSGKFKSFQENKEVLEASGAEIITVAVRRVNITDRSKENLLDYIDPNKYQILPNTAGCYTAEEAIKTAMLARVVGQVLNLLKIIGGSWTRGRVWNTPPASTLLWTCINVSLYLENQYADESLWTLISHRSAFKNILKI